MSAATCFARHLGKNTQPIVQVKQSIARLRLVWDERMKLKTAMRAEEKAIEEKARAAENKITRKKRKDEQYIRKRMAKFASVTPEQP